MNGKEPVEASISFSDVLDFWFAPGQEQRWFVKDAKFDAEIRERFLPLYTLARDGKLQAWGEKSYPALALILLFDQFSRNMFRSTPQAFATDPPALALTKEGLAKGFRKELSSDRLAFFYMPLVHSEQLADQDLSVSLFEKDQLTEYLPHAIIHRDIIARFGRYPHRNAILGRISTPEEIEFLKGPNSSF